MDCPLPVLLRNPLAVVMGPEDPRGLLASVPWGGRQRESVCERQRERERERETEREEGGEREGGRERERERKREREGEYVSCAEYSAPSAWSIALSLLRGRGDYIYIYIYI